VTAVVVDTNVFAVADGHHEHASPHCVAACTALVEKIAAGHPIAVDDGDRIFLEYLGRLDASKAAGKLVKRLYSLRFGGRVCELVRITPAACLPAMFNEVPAMLHTFDNDDQKFIAVATEAGADIYAGLDGEWWDRRADFVAEGITVHFVCAADMPL